MVRTQIQLSDELYRRLKVLAKEREWSLAEAIRRGAEMLLRSFPREPIEPEKWRLPEARPLGAFRSDVESWRALANEQDA